MANIEHLGRINQGVGAWNTWRTENPEVLPDLRGAYLLGANLLGANLRGANLWGANLRDANLRDANLLGANLRGADLRGADLWGANLRDAPLRGASLRGAYLRDAYLQTGEKWEVYLSEVLPAYLTAGGKTIKDFINAEGVLECHSWNNCPTAFAFGAKNMEGVPILLRPRAEQFIQLWDQGLITRVHIEGLM